MHLKQDTDLALRVVFYLGREAAGRGPAFQGCPLSDIARAASMPPVRAGRICACLERHAILLARQARGQEPVYWPGAAFWSGTLLDVVLAVEGRAELFALFDRDSALFRARGGALDGVQTELERLLRGVTLDRLIRAQARIAAR